MKKGKLIGIGVGPGDSALLTVKAAEAIKNADIIITPKTEKKGDSVAYAIASPYIQKNTELLYMEFPMITDIDKIRKAWENNRKILKKELDAGKILVFLTLGDPMFYSTYMYILRALEKEDYNIETIPGIPAFLGIASYLNRPVTEWEETVTILPATASEERIDEVMAMTDNIVIMKVYKNFSYILKELKKHGFIDDAVMVSRYGLPDETIYKNLTDLPDGYCPNYLSTILAKKRK